MTTTTTTWSLVRVSKSHVIAILFLVFFTSLVRAQSVGAIDGLSSIARPREQEAAYRQYFAGRRFILVKGLFNEILSNPISRNLDYLREYVSERSGAQNVHTLTPSSLRTVEEGAQVIRAKLVELLRQDPRGPVTVMGHSKGGSEVAHLAMVLASEGMAELGNELSFRVPRHVQFVSLNGSILGTFIAEIPLRGCARFQEGSTVRNQCQSIADQLGQGLDSLSEPESEHRVNLIRNRCDETCKATLNRQLFYEISHQNYSEIASVLRATWAILRITGSFSRLSGEGGENDGLVLKRNQFAPGLGQVFEMEDVDHTDLAVAMPVSSKTDWHRKVLFDRIFNHLSQRL